MSDQTGRLWCSAMNKFADEMSREELLICLEEMTKDYQSLIKENYRAHTSVNDMMGDMIKMQKQHISDRIKLGI